MKNITFKHFSILFLSNILTYNIFLLHCKNHFENEVAAKTWADSMLVCFQELFKNKGVSTEF